MTDVFNQAEQRKKFWESQTSMTDKEKKELQKHIEEFLNEMWSEEE